ncbi:MAG: MBL fold metallo-hydrolase, partial [Clostridia bacterium]
ELKSRKLDVSAAVISNIKTEDEPLVWIPKTGKKYHSSSTCSNMKQPKQVSLDVAKELGFTPCKKCNPPH